MSTPTKKKAPAKRSAPAKKTGAPIAKKTGGNAMGLGAKKPARSAGSTNS
ncbi:MAG: hypothetical protein NVSMB64_14010 [Candidatus Velthaea sp.]